MNKIKKLYEGLNGGKNGLRFTHNIVEVDSYHDEDGEEVVVTADSIYEDEDGTLMLGCQDWEVTSLTKCPQKVLDEVYWTMKQGTEERV